MIDWLTACFARILSLLLQALPLKTALSFGRAFGIILFHTSARRHIAYVNLKAAFGDRFSAEERKEIVKRHFCNLAQTAVEVLRFPKMDQTFLERYVLVENREHYEQTVQKNQGAVLITPHFGNWELSQVLSAIVGRPMHVLARQQKHTKLDDFLNELRTTHGSIAIHKGGGVRDLIRTLRKGGMVGVLGDLSGGRSGDIVRFFGRKTTAPSGVFEIAKRTNSIILPCFMVRLEGLKHQVFIEKPFPLVSTGNEEKDIKETVQNYYHLLETWISKYPEQWFWMYKRWKYCFTKRVLVLRDERAGHTNQSEAIAHEFEKLGGPLPEDYEFEFHSAQVKFKSSWHRRLFFLFAFFAYPFVQGRLGFLKFFLEPECVKPLCDTHADLIISAGSSLAPLNLLLKKENLAKSIVVMKPSFPYLAHFFDLLIVPVHDAFPKRHTHAVRTLITPSRMDDRLVQSSSQKIKEVVSLGSNGAKRISVFIGGKAKSYQFQPVEFRKWLTALKACAKESRSELLVTTSRRTDPEINTIVKEELGSYPATKLLVIANESNFENVTHGMLALSDVALVTEDSISMISEAISAGKNVLVMQLGNGKLPKKHSRFHQALESNALIHLADATNFSEKLNLIDGLKKDDFIQRQSKLIQKALRKLL